MSSKSADFKRFQSDQAVGREPVLSFPSHCRHLCPAIISFDVLHQLLSTGHCSAGAVGLRRVVAWWPPNQLPLHQQWHQDLARYTSRSSLGNSSCCPKCWRTEHGPFLELIHDLQLVSKTSSPPGILEPFKLSSPTHTSYCFPTCNPLSMNMPNMYEHVR